MAVLSGFFILKIAYLLIIRDTQLPARLKWLYLSAANALLRFPRSWFRVYDGSGTRFYAE